jgi:hypothetical protein
MDIEDIADQYAYNAAVKERVRAAIREALADTVPRSELEAAQARIKELEAQIVTAREYTAGRWHHGAGFLCMGTIRVAREDFDSEPTQEVKTEIFDEICAVLNGMHKASGGE